MIRLRLQVVVARPVEQVFAYTADMQHMPEWAAGPVSCAQTSPGPEGAGTTYEVIAKPPIGPLMKSEYVITSFERDRVFTGRGSAGPLRFQERYRFVPVPDATRIVYDLRAQPPGALRLLQPVIKLFLSRLLGSDLKRLKQRIEALPAAA